MKQEKIKFVLRTTVFLLLALVPLLPEILYDFGNNNYRTWESVTTRALNTNRPFYVNRVVKREEEGDLGVHTPYAVRKKTTWKTDRFGYRNREDHDQYDVIVFGDSEITGSGLTQEKTFSELLSQKTKQTVYPFAPADINDFVAEPRWSERPPKKVIFGRIESSLHKIPRLHSEGIPKKKTARFLFIEKMEDGIDYLLKFSFYRTALSKARYRLFPKKVLLDPNTKMLFSAGALRARDINLNHLNRTIETIEEYDRFFSAQGVQFLFMPIPEKETIYAKNLPITHEEYRSYTHYMDQLYSELDKRQIKVIKLYEPFKREKERVFQLDDTHWNEKGVGIAVHETAMVLNELVTK